MKYNKYDIPVINKSYSYQNDSNRVISSTSGEIKVFYCDPILLEDVLLSIDGKNTFKQIEDIYKVKYQVKEVENFLTTLLDEGVIEIYNSESQTQDNPAIIVIGDGLLSSKFLEYENVYLISIYDFLQNKYEKDFDFAIFAPSDCTYSDVININKKLYNYKKPYINFNFNGDNFLLGPFIIPEKTICLECILSTKLKKINNNLSKLDKMIINDLKNIIYSYDVSKENFKYSVNLISYLSNKIYSEIINYFNGFSSNLINKQYSYKNNSYNFDEFEYLPTTYCDFCNGINKNYITIDNKDLIAKMLDKTPNILSHHKIKYQTGGIRSKDETETKKILDKELENLGSEIRIEFDENNPFKYLAPSYSAYYNRIYNSSPFIFNPDRGAGKGLTKSQAYFSAGFEIIEHITRQYSGDIPIISAKYSDVSEVAIDAPYLASTVMNSHTSYDKFDINDDIDWVVGTSISNGEKKLIPAFLVFMFDVDLKGTFFGTASTGIASAATLEDAILHGLFEIIEHDAWLIGQSNPYILPIVDYSSSKNEKIKEIINTIKHKGFEIITRDYTNDLTIPVYRTYITNRKNFSQYSYNGFGCHISPEIALERSVTEAVQFCDGLFGGSENGLITKDVLSTSLVNLYNQHYLVNKDIIGNTNNKTLINAPLFDYDSSYELIQKITNLIKDKIDGDVYYVELTKPGMNVRVVRTIVTGEIQRMNHPIISASRRLFEFGIRCGYDDKKISYEELFMGDYQH